MGRAAVPAIVSSVAKFPAFVLAAILPIALVAAAAGIPFRKPRGSSEEDTQLGTSM